MNALHAWENSDIPQYVCAINLEIWKNGYL